MKISLIFYCTFFTKEILLLCSKNSRKKLNYNITCNSHFHGSLSSIDNIKDKDSKTLTNYILSTTVPILLASRKKKKICSIFFHTHLLTQNNVGHTTQIKRKCTTISPPFLLSKEIFLYKKIIIILFPRVLPVDLTLFLVSRAHTKKNFFFSSLLFLFYYYYLHPLWLSLCHWRTI